MCRCPDLVLPPERSWPKTEATARHLRMVILPGSRRFIVVRSSAPPGLSDKPARANRGLRLSGSAYRSRHNNQGSGHARTIFSIIFDCWRGNAVNLSMLSRSAAREQSASMRIKISGKEARNANAGHSADTEKRGPSSRCCRELYVKTRRVRHCWLADIVLAPAFVRHNHAVSWTAATTPVGSTVPGYPRGHGGAIDCGSGWNLFSRFYHDATLAD